MPTTFDFTADGGLLPAAELCAGVGACRKTREGTMCPSFQATRDEKDSTRGRANLLRLAITGQLGFEGFTDPAVHEVLDLCLECKACKSECPTNVDMARLKAEFLHQYHREAWPALAQPRLRPRGRAGSGRVGAGAGVELADAKRSGALAQREAAGDRPPPHAARVCAAIAGPAILVAALARASSIDGRHVASCSSPTRSPITFEPEVGAAAIELLQAAGCEVTLGPPGLRCCGRPLISNGLLDEAVANARHNVERLHEWARRGGPIIACEPSCILTIKDDYPALLQGRASYPGRVGRRRLPDVRGVSRVAHCREETGRGTSRCRAGPRRILVQAHCHQRSLVGIGPLLKLLASDPRSRGDRPRRRLLRHGRLVRLRDRAYEISRLVGEQRLFPAVRQAEPDAVVVAPGFSCRLQIEHFTGRQAIHPAEILRSCIFSENQRQA